MRKQSKLHLSIAISLLHLHYLHICVENVLFLEDYIHDLNAHYSHRERTQQGVGYIINYHKGLLNGSSFKLTVEARSDHQSLHFVDTCRPRNDYLEHCNATGHHRILNSFRLLYCLQTNRVLERAYPQNIPFNDLVSHHTKAAVSRPHHCTRASPPSLQRVQREEKPLFSPS